MTQALVFCRECGSSRPLTMSTTEFCCHPAKVAFKETPDGASRIDTPMINGKSVSWDQALKTISALK